MKVDEIYSFSALNNELEQITTDLIKSCDELRAAGRKWATAENDYRRAKSVAFLQQTEGTVPTRQALVDKVCERERLAAHIAEADREACLERVRSLRSILSAYQTLARVNQTEIEMSGLPEPRWGINNSR